METPINIPDELLAEAREAFNLFDKESAGSIQTKDVGLVIRSLGFNLSDADLARMEQEADPEGLGFVKFHEFEKLLGKVLVITKASSAEAKKVIRTIGDSINRLTGRSNEPATHVSLHDLKHLLTRTGEKMSHEEFSEMCKDLDIQNGKISIDHLVNYLVI
jgi:calmodulin